MVITTGIYHNLLLSPKRNNICLTFVGSVHWAYCNDCTTKYHKTSKYGRKKWIHFSDVSYDSNNVNNQEMKTKTENKHNVSVPCGSPVAAIKYIHKRKIVLISCFLDTHCIDLLFRDTSRIFTIFSVRGQGHWVIFYNLGHVLFSA